MPHTILSAQSHSSSLYYTVQLCGLCMRDGLIHYPLMKHIKVCLLFMISTVFNYFSTQFYKHVNYHPSPKLLVVYFPSLLSIHKVSILHPKISAILFTCFICSIHLLHGLFHQTVFSSHSLAILLSSILVISVCIYMFISTLHCYTALLGLLHTQ